MFANKAFAADAKSRSAEKQRYPFKVFVCTEILPQHIPSLCRAQTK